MSVIGNNEKESNNKLTVEELNKIKEYNKNYYNTITVLGEITHQLETLKEQKIVVSKEVTKIKKELDEFINIDLRKKYGENISINSITGEITTV